MPKNILVVTATIGFGELIQQTIEETGKYRVILLTSAAEAMGLVQESSYAMAILDSDVNDLPYQDFIHALHKVAPGLKLVLIPPDHERENILKNHPAVKGFLSKPFYLPDLLELVAMVLGPVSEPSLVTKPTTPRRETHADNQKFPPWLEDVSRAAQHLTGLLLGTAAQAALIVRDRQLWAYAGQLAQPAAQELSSLVARYWEQEKALPSKTLRSAPRSDLARFVTLGTTGSEYMLYATGMAAGLILALAFDAETPFSKIRSQTSQLARALANSACTSQPVGRNAAIAVNDAASEQRSLPIHSSNQPGRAMVQEIPDLSDDWIKMESLAEDFANEEEEHPEQELEPLLKSETQHTQSSTDNPTSLHPEVSSGETAAPLIVLEPAFPGIINLVYACVIIPRLPKHKLVGDLAEKLVEWIRQLCLAFGWRLENITIFPGYVQWIINVTPTTSPSYLMRILRQHTSKRIFAEFPALVQDNPSGDFWAPGYLIMSSPNPPPDSVIHEFIHQIRQHQGVSNPLMPHFER